MIAYERWSLTRGGRKGRFDCVKEHDAPCDSSTFCTRDHLLIKHRGGKAGGKISSVEKK